MATRFDLDDAKRRRLERMADRAASLETTKETSRSLQSRLVVSRPRGIPSPKRKIPIGSSVQSPRLGSAEPKIRPSERYSMPPVPTSPAKASSRGADRYVKPKAPQFNAVERRTPVSETFKPEVQESRQASPRMEKNVGDPTGDGKEQMHTPFDFIEYIRSHPDTLEFVYLRPLRRGRYRHSSPYDLVIIPHSEVNMKDYYTLSASGITHFVEGVAEFTPLDHWEREYSLYSKIKNIPVFQKFRLWKGFSVWRKNVRSFKMNTCKDMLKETLPGCNPTLRKAMLRVRELCYDTLFIRMYSLTPSVTYTLEDFANDQEKRRVDSYDQLVEIQGNARQHVLNACENVLMAADFNKKDRQDEMFDADAEQMWEKLDFAGRGGLRSGAMSGGGPAFRAGTNPMFAMSPGASRGKMSFTDMAAKRNLCVRLVNYIRLVDYLLANSLHRLVINSVADLQTFVSPPLSDKKMEELLSKSSAFGLNEITAEGVETGPQMRKRVKKSEVPDILVHTGAAQKKEETSPLFEVELMVLDNDELGFVPPSIDFHDCIDAVISDWVSTVRSIEPLIRHEVFHLFTHPMMNLRQEVIEVGDGPKLGEIICTDVHYQALLQGIRERLTAGFDAAFRYARVFEPFKNIYLENRAMDIDDVRSRAEAGEITLADFQATMDKYDLQHSDMEKITELADIGLICVDSYKLKQLFLPAPVQCLQDVHVLLPQLAYAKNKALLDELNVANMQLLSTPQTVKSFVEHLQYLQEINDRQDELKHKFNEITAHYELMSEYKVEVPVEEKAAYQMLQPEYTKLQASISLCEAAKETNIAKFSTALSKDIQKLRQDVMEIRGQATHSMVSDQDADPAMVIEYLTALQETTQRLEEQAKNYARYQHLFRVPIEHYDDLEAVSSDLSLKLNLWTSLRDWQIMTAKWTTARFDLDIDPEAINTGVMRYSKVVLQVERGLSGNQVVPKLKALVQEFKQMLPVILDLRNNALKPRHWERIEEVIGKKGGLVRDDTFTLGLLLDLGIMKYREEISQISTEATQEAVLEELVQKVKNLWEQTEFAVIPYKEKKDSCILAQVDDIVALLEDSQVTISTVAGSRYVGPIKAEVTELENNLRLFSDTLDEWLNVQRNWMYLESIFEAPDLKSQLPDEDAAFTQVNTMYKDVMLHTRDFPNALKAATQPGLLEKLQNGVEELDRIQKALEIYLEQKRMSFPRFYFLSNDELLEILSHSRNPTAVEPHLRKIFDNIYQLEFGSTDSRTPDIIAMISGEGERVELGKNLKARGGAEEWLNEVQKEMFKTMRKELTRAFQSYTRHPRTEWIGMCPAQMILAISQVYWCHNVVECFHSDNPQSALQEFLEKSLDQLSDLAELVRSCESELLRRAVVALITMDVHSRDIVEQLIKDEVSAENDFGWTQRLRYYYDAEDNECIVRQSNATFNYGYEYLGNTTRLVITPLTDRCYMTCSSALHLHLGGAPAGPAGTGKTETVKDLAKALALLCIVFNCFSPDTLIRMADGRTKRVDAITEGEEVMGDDGQKRRVVETYSGVTERYRIKEIHPQEGKTRDDLRKNLTDGIFQSDGETTESCYPRYKYVQPPTFVEDGFVTTGGHTNVVYLAAGDFARMYEYKSENRSGWRVKYISFHGVDYADFEVPYETEKSFSYPNSASVNSIHATREAAKAFLREQKDRGDISWEVTSQDLYQLQEVVKEDPKCRNFYLRYLRMKRIPVKQWPSQRRPIMEIIESCYPECISDRLSDRDVGRWLGMWLGDGVVGNPTFYTADNEIVDRLREIAEKVGYTISDLRSSNADCRVVRMLKPTDDPQHTRNLFCNILRSLNILNVKELSDELIDDMVSEGIQFRLGVLDGLLDTDGSLCSLTEATTKSGVYTVGGRAYEFKQAESSKEPGHATIALLCRDVARSLGCSATHKKYITEYLEDAEVMIGPNLKKVQKNERVIIHVIRIHGLEEVMTQLRPAVGRKRYVSDDRNELRVHDLYPFTIEKEEDGEFNGFQVDGNHRIMLGDFTISRNCGEGIDYQFMNKFFSGLAQTGAWACCDEFNRIDIEVLSVIAQQLMTVQTALKSKQGRFMFGDTEMLLVNTFGFFITMNPGYAGRTELPDNLKALFRPVSMMVPDYGMIAEIMLMSEGFENGRDLSRKMVKMYKLCSEQLSQQDHYDFGMRALKSILVMAGALKRENPELHEDVVLIRAMRDSNVPKFLSDDLILFEAIVSDLFPGIEIPAQAIGDLKSAIEHALTQASLEVVPALVEKMLQLYETMKVRFGVMIVGPTGGGKSTCYRALQTAQSELATKEIEDFHEVKTHVLNPKCISMGELYGEFNELTHEWSDGLAASIVRDCVADMSDVRKWVVFDGPVDALWIENMNTVLDDNRMLCLSNGERIKLPETMSMLFEVQDLATASPATVSRCGMVYVPAEGLGWKPYVTAWQRNVTSSLPEVVDEHIRELFENNVGPALVKVRELCKEDIPSVDFNLVTSLCNLLESMMQLEGVDLSLSENKEDTPYVTAQANIQSAKKLVEKLFLFSLVWSIGGNCIQSTRAALDDWFRHQFDFIHIPPEGTAFDYFVDIPNNAIKAWEAEVPAFEFSDKAPFFQILVPTVDTMRYKFLFETLVRGGKNVMFSGVTGVGKSVIISHALAHLEAEHNTVPLVVNFSARTTSIATQTLIESKLEKKRKTIFGAPHGKKVCIFVDDVNMPAREEYGAQPPVELLRQLADFGGMYDRKKLFWKEVQDSTLAVACAPPGGGRNPVTPRFFRHFHMVNVSPPTQNSLFTIFSSILQGFLNEWDSSIRLLTKGMVNASIEVYSRITQELLPTPAKSHYTFNLRDLSKVFQGILSSKSTNVPDSAAMTRLWCHETMRVFHDRLISDEDRKFFTTLLVEMVKKHFGTSWSHEEMFVKKSVLWIDFMKTGVPPSERNLEEVRKPEKLQEVLDYYLSEYNIELNKDVKLVFFKDAIDHLCRIVRIIRQTRGNAMLVGVGGSGRQSLARLAAFVCEMECFQIELTRHYGSVEFREDLKKLYQTAGVKGQPVVFLLNEPQIVEESFLEDINNILNSGEVPGLFAQDEREKILELVRPYVRAAGLSESRDSVWSYFIYRVRDNLHVVLCMSPVGGNFRARCRQFPSLVNTCAIDWYDEWPEDALLSVSRSFFEDADMGDSATPEVKEQIAQMCVFMHQTVAQTSKKFYEEMRRRYYVTPKSYLDLIQLYLTLFNERKEELLSARSRLQNGLSKLVETNELVHSMEKELNELQPVLKQKAVETGKLLEQLARNQKNTDQLKNVVQAEEAVVKKQTTETEILAADARKDLEEALPALEAALEALNSLNKNDITEIKSFTKPPILVQTVMEATCVLLQVKPDWDTSRKVLADTRFLQRLINYDRDHIPDIVLRKLKKYIDDPTFLPDNVANVSFAARSLCMWIRAIDNYSKVAKKVRPKEERLREAEAMLSEARSKLQTKQEQLAGIEKKLAELRRQYEMSQAEKASLQQRIELTSTRLERASKLTSLLGDEQVRWDEEAERKTSQLAELVGDVFVAAACVSYFGAFTGKYRADVVEQWVKQCKAHGLLVSDPFVLRNVLSNPVQIREWTLNSLPTDNLSIENAILTERGKRWPLMIDPQGQAKRWIKNMERDNGLKIIRFQQSDYLRTLQHAVAMGTPVLLEDVGETLDAAIEPLLQKAVFRKGSRNLIRLGDADIDYIPTFRFYMTTKLANPHFLPETCILVTVINFTVTPVGLQDQLLGDVVRKERPDLEEQKDSLVVKMASDKKTLKDLEDKILHLLSTSEGIILDKEVLISALNEAKQTSKDITRRVVEAEATEKDINKARDVYMPVAVRGAVIFFVIADLAQIDPMYQYSLQYFQRLFSATIDATEKPDSVEKRLELLNQAISRTLFLNVSRGLFEQHKLIFSFLIVSKILLNAGDVSPQEWNSFLGRGLPEKQVSKSNPVRDWLPAKIWDEVCGIESEVDAFDGLTDKFAKLKDEWKLLYESSDLTAARLPGELDKELTWFQKLCLIRRLRPEKTLSYLPTFISNTLGKEFTEMPPFNLEDVYRGTSPAAPIIFILSTGADPTGYLLRFAEEKQYRERLHMISLGQGQGPIASSMIDSAVKSGDWVLLQNCHLARSWMPQLEAIVSKLLAVENGDLDEFIHPDFRLWLTSMPTKDFPVPVLQNGIKLTNEPPRGLRANIRRSYADLGEDKFESCSKSRPWKKLLFGLAFFHALLQERRKFGPLGWNIRYEFNNSDFEVSVAVLRMFLEEHRSVPWKALRYVTGEILYGGRVTDEWDRRLLMTQLNSVYSEEVLSDSFSFSKSGTYVSIPVNDYYAYLTYIEQLPQVEEPEVFGMHSNASIAYELQETTKVMEVIIDTQPRIAASGEARSEEEIVYDLAGSILDDLPESLTMDEAGERTFEKTENGQLNSLATVLTHEIERFNRLLTVMRISLIDLQKAIRGLVVMSADLEKMFRSLTLDQVPEQWASVAYPSLKNLAGWIPNLKQRVDFIRDWLRNGEPTVFWIPGLFFPQGFMTGVLQNHARKHKISIDRLSFEFTVIDDQPKEFLKKTEDGVYVGGLLLEGAQWDSKNHCLADPTPGEMYSTMPVIHFSPKEDYVPPDNCYSCPVYKTVARAGVLSTTGHSTNFVVPVDLDSGEHSPESWIRRGTGLLCSLPSEEPVW